MCSEANRLPQVDDFPSLRGEALSAAVCVDQLPDDLARRLLAVQRGEVSLPPGVQLPPDEPCDDFMADVYPVFEGELAQLRCAIVVSWANRDRLRLRATAHKLLGVTGTFGMHGASELASLLRDAARQPIDEELALTLVAHLLVACCPEAVSAHRPPPPTTESR